MIVLGVLAVLFVVCILFTVSLCRMAARGDYGASERLREVRRYADEDRDV